MYKDLYLENLNTEIFIESIEMVFDNIYMNDSLDILLEGGNDNKNIIMRAVDAIVRKIREIIDWIKDKLFGDDNKKYEDFLKLVDSKVPGLYVEFEKSPRKVYELYTDIFNVISKNYDKSSENDSSNFIEDIKDKLDRNVDKENLSPKECIDLFYKYNKLSFDYKQLSDKISSYIKSKANAGINCSQEQKTLSLITKVVSDIRSNMSKISPAKISTNNSILSKVDKWAEANPKKATLIIASLGTISVLARIRSRIKTAVDKSVKEMEML